MIAGSQTPQLRGGLSSERTASISRYKYPNLFGRARCCTRAEADDQQLATMARTLMGWVGY